MRVHWTTPNPAVPGVLFLYVRKGLLQPILRDNYVPIWDHATQQWWLCRHTTSGVMAIRQVPRFMRRIDNRNPVTGEKIQMIIIEKLYTERQYELIRWTLRQVDRRCLYVDICNVLRPHWRQLYGQRPLSPGIVAGWQIVRDKHRAKGQVWP